MRKPIVVLRARELEKPKHGIPTSVSATLCVDHDVHVSIDDGVWSTVGLQVFSITSVEVFSLGVISNCTLYSPYLIHAVANGCSDERMVIYLTNWCIY